MVELRYLERREGFVIACMYESNWGGYSYRKFMDYSKKEIVKKLRECGVVCPHKAYERIY